MFKINIHNLKEGEHKYEFIARSLDFEISDSELEIPGEINISVVLYKISHQISVKAYLKGNFVFQCDRCLDKYNENFSTNFDIIYKYDFKDSYKDEIHFEDDIKFILPNTLLIDLKEDLRDFILLSVPMRKAPEDSEGKCTFCHKDITLVINIPDKKEINPVWEKLVKSKT